MALWIERRDGSSASLAALHALSMATLVAVNQSARVSANYDCSLGLVIGFISVKTLKTLLSCSAAGTKVASNKT